jgi:hypothetical protein
VGFIPEGFLSSALSVSAFVIQVSGSSNSSFNTGTACRGSMPSAVSEFEAALPQHALLSFEQDNFTITQMGGVWFCVGECAKRAVWFSL